MLRILHVEDDHLSAEWLSRSVKEAFPDAQIDLIKTEAGFRSELKRIIQRPPDIVVMDVMLRWTDPSPDMAPRPVDVEKEGVFRAGIRCKDLLTENNLKMPILLYTVLERNDLEKDLEQFERNIVYFPKSADATPLINEIRRLTTGRDHEA